MILIGVLAASAWYVAWPMWRAQSFEPNPEHYNYATLPRGAPREAPPMDRARLASVTDASQLRTGRRNCAGSESRRQTRSTRTRTSNFAGWTATVDGGLAEIKEGAVKNVVIDLPEGAHSVTLELRSTPARRAGNLITIPAGASVFDNHCRDPHEIGVRQKTGAVLQQKSWRTQ